MPEPREQLSRAVVHEPARQRAKRSGPGVPVFDRPKGRTRNQELARAGLPPDCPLTPAEYRAVILLADGLNRKQIAADMGCAWTTVRTHLHNAYRKMGVANGPAAVVFAYRNGWLVPMGCCPTCGQPRNGEGL